MNRIGAALLRSGKDCIHVQIRLGRLRWSDAYSLIRQLYRERFRIGVRMHLDRGNAEFARRPYDADGDLAPVCDQEFADGHGLVSLLSLPLRRAARPP